MRPVARLESGNPQLLFLPTVFNEALSLLFDAHHYFESRGAEDYVVLGPQYQQTYTHEMTRITTRLTSIMAWVMVRRAVTAGRIDEDKAADSYRLEGPEICGEPPEGTLDMLPYYFWHLSERSQELYERIGRLDEMVYGSRH